MHLLNTYRLLRAIATAIVYVALRDLAQAPSRTETRHPQPALLAPPDPAEPEPETDAPIPTPGRPGGLAGLTQEERGTAIARQHTAMIRLMWAYHCRTTYTTMQHYQARTESSYVHAVYKEHVIATYSCN